MEKLFTLVDAGKLLGVSASTLSHQARAGRLEATLLGKTYVVDQAAIEAYRREHLGKIGRPPGAADRPHVVRTPRRTRRKDR